MPAFDGHDYLVRVSGPGEGLWRLVCFGDEAIDSGQQIDHRSEDASLQLPLGQLDEVSLHGAESGAGGRREVEGGALVPSKPSMHLGVLMGGVIVEDT